MFGKAVFLGGTSPLTSRLPPTLSTEYHIAASACLSHVGIFLLDSRRLGVVWLELVDGMRGGQKGRGWVMERKVRKKGV